MIPKSVLNKKQTSFKVEVRRLPPLLNETEFYQTLIEFNDNIQQKYYVQGKLKQFNSCDNYIREQEKIDSRCYLFFSNAQKMTDFISGYKKVFADEKGIYYRPDIRKSFFQNQQDLQKNEKNKLEGQYEDSDTYKAFLLKLQQDQNQNDQQVIQQEEEQQEKTDEKPKRVKTALVLQMEEEYKRELARKQEIEKLSKSQHVIQIQCQEKGKTIQKVFIFVPKAKQ